MKNHKRKLLLHLLGSKLDSGHNFKIYYCFSKFMFLDSVYIYTIYISIELGKKKWLN